MSVASHCLKIPERMFMKNVEQVEVGLGDGAGISDCRWRWLAIAAYGISRSRRKISS